MFEYERGARIKKSDRVVGNIPLVTAGKINTGVSGYIEIHNKYEERPCLTIDMFGNTFYRDYPFYYDDNIIVFKNKKYSKWVYLYICGAVSYLQNIYSYTKQFRVKEIDNNYVKIPITSQGVPDWQYMEDFMRNIEQESEEVIKKIQNMP